MLAVPRASLAVPDVHGLGSPPGQPPFQPPFQPPGQPPAQPPRQPPAQPPRQPSVQLPRQPSQVVIATGLGFKPQTRWERLRARFDSQHPGMHIFEDEATKSGRLWSDVCNLAVRPMVVLLLMLGPGSGKSGTAAAGHSLVPLVTFGALGGLAHLLARLAAKGRAAAAAQGCAVLVDGLLLAASHPAVQAGQWDRLGLRGLFEPPCWTAIWDAGRDTGEEAACDTLRASAVSTAALQLWISALIIMVLRVRDSVWALASVAVYCAAVLELGRDVHAGLLLAVAPTTLLVWLAKWRLETVMITLCDACEDVESLRARVRSPPAGMPVVATRSATRPTLMTGGSKFMTRGGSTSSFRAPFDIRDFFHKSISSVAASLDLGERSNSNERPTSPRERPPGFSNADVANASYNARNYHTASSSVVFGGFGARHGQSLGYDVNRVKALARQEHWLVATEDLEISEVKTLGRGGFGSVMEGAFQGTPCAVKLARGVTLGGGGAEVQGLEQLVNELRILRHVRHPNIVLFHGACMDLPCNQLALVLEQVEGRDLLRWLTGGPDESRGGGGSAVSLGDDGGPEWSPAAGEPGAEPRVYVLLGTCRALRYLHSRVPTVVHGDLKPSNILVETHGSRPRTKLLDFGLSRLIKEEAAPLGGTIRWCAPEIFEAARPSPAADSFSFGRVTYMVATNRLPFGHTEQRLLRKMIMESAPLRWPGRQILVSARPLATRCMSYEPEARPRMPQVQEALDEWLRDCAAAVGCGAGSARRSLVTQPGGFTTSGTSGSRSSGASASARSVTVEL